jgi:signal transduction histidine kinase
MVVFQEEIIRLIINNLGETPICMTTNLHISYAELQEKFLERTRILATLLEVSRNMTSVLELEPLLGLILEQLKSVIDYDGTSILKLDDSELRLLAYRGPIPQEEARHIRFPLQAAGVNREVIQRKEPIIIPDTRGNTPLAIAFQQTASDQLETAFGYIRSWMGVPLIVRDQAIGMLSLDHRQENYYTADHAALVLAFANQAAVAIENAQLYAEARRRADEIETMFNVQQAIASPLEWDEVLQLIADAAHRLTATRFSAVFLLDGNKLRLSTLSGEGTSNLHVGYELPMHQSAAGYAIRTGQPVLMKNAAEDARANRDAILRTGAQSLLATPLIHGQQPIGAILVVDKSPGQLGPEDERVLAMLASGAVIQIENARLFAEADRRMQELEALYHADEELLQNLSLDQVLQALVDVAADIFQADKSSLMIWDAQREKLVVGAACGFSPETMDSMVFDLGEGIVGHVATSGQPSVVEDSTAVPDVARWITQAEAIRAFMHVPVKIEGQIFGVFNVSYLQPRRFGEDELRLFIALGQRAALAIQNAQLHEQSQQAAVWQERQRLARELHDAVTQTLFSASIIAEVVPRLWERDPEMARQRLDELRELTRGALAEMRNLLMELRPSAIAEAELHDLLRQLASAFTGRTRIPIEVNANIDCLLPPDVKVALYRIAQEALNNVAKHAHASHVKIEMDCQDQELRLAIRDDGRGFDPQGMPSDRLGLGIMHERAAAIGAALHIESRPQDGTQIEVVWPKDTSS